MDMKESIKHLTRTPAKALIFFLLMASSTLFLVFGAVMTVQTDRRIEAAKQEFSTIGTIEQKPVFESNAVLTNTCSSVTASAAISSYADMISSDSLLFEGASYEAPPENRPYYLSYMPDFHTKYSSMGAALDDVYIMEFTPLTNLSASGSAEVRVERILYSRASSQGAYIDLPEEAGTITLCSHFSKELQPLQAGKKYIATVILDWSSTNTAEYAIYSAPFTTQYNSDGTVTEGGQIDHGNSLTMENGTWSYVQPEENFSPDIAVPVYAEEVTPDFYKETGRGQVWLNWVEEHKKYQYYFSVMPTNSLELLPSFHEKQVTIQQGRAITPEEFQDGAMVCMLPQDLLVRNLLSVGDKVTLSLVMSLHGYCVQPAILGSTYAGSYSPLNAQGMSYAPFWEAEYEIVGTYQFLNEGMQSNSLEIKDEMFIIPANSVKASDENNIAYFSPMTRHTASFQIANGTIDEFDKALHEAVPQAEQLTITYDDNGYSDIISSLETARLTAFLLLLAAAATTLVVIVLLLYFFIVKQKKRTAIERSLGYSKHQCRVSLIAGVLLLTILATGIGSGCGTYLSSNLDLNAEIENTVDISNYDTTFSMWAKAGAANEMEETEVPAPIALYIAIPLLITLFVWVLAHILLDANLKTEPFLLLSSKSE